MTTKKQELKLSKVEAQFLADLLQKSKTRAKRTEVLQLLTTLGNKVSRLYPEVKEVKKARKPKVAKTTD